MQLNQISSLTAFCLSLLLVQQVTFCEDPVSDSKRPLETFVEKLRTQIAEAPLQEAFSANSDTVKDYLNNHIEEMVSNLFATQKTQKEHVKNPWFSFTVKVRQRDGELEILAKSPCGKGGFKTIAKVVQIVGHALKHQPEQIYAYAKSKRRKSLQKKLAVLECELASAPTSEERERLESSVAAIESKLRHDQIDLADEIRISQLLPGDKNFIKMWPVKKNKDHSQIKGILMEYCPYSLRDAIVTEQHPLSTTAFLRHCRFALAISRSLAIMHSKAIGLCHLDVKSGNILISDNNGILIPKITDFGLVEKIGTPSNGPRGTLPYMAPEHFDLSVETFEPSMDNWGLGMILVELFYGKSANVFWSNSDVEKVGIHFNESSHYPEFLTVWQVVREQVVEQLTRYPDLDPLIRGLLTVDPTKRFTAQQAVEVFENILHRIPCTIVEKSPSACLGLCQTEWDDPRDITRKSNSREFLP